MQNFHKVIIIGAGPIGLYFASLCKKASLDYFVLEGTDQIGGQISHLYPEKEIVDLPNIDSIKAIDYVKLLSTLVDQDKIALNETVKNIKNSNIIEITTDQKVYYSNYLVIATGLGASKPRPLGVENEDKCDNIIYSVKGFEHFRNKRVAIFGGGDSALDWAKEISAISDDVHLIHRRLEFRGNPETIKDCKNLQIHLPYIPYSIKITDKKATSITIKKVDEDEIYIEIPVDFIFVNYGNVASPLTFPFEMDNAFLKVNDKLEVAQNIYAIGDVASYQNKTRRLAPGIKEAESVLQTIISK